MNNRPIVMVISGPSGSGKDTVLNILKPNYPDLVHITTATTRAPREGEIDGVHYYFKTEEEFEDMVQRDELLEHATVYDKHYGVPKQPVRDALAAGKDTVIKVDVQGAMTIKSKLPEAILFFITTKDVETIIERLHLRNTETGEVLQTRIDMIREENKLMDKFDHIIYNENGKADEAARQIEKVIAAEKKRKSPRVYDLDPKFKLDLCGQDYCYSGAESAYLAGAHVLFYYRAEMVGTDMDYSFQLDGEDFSCPYRDGKGFKVEFTMPDHDVKLQCIEKISMIRGAGPDQYQRR